MAKRFERNLLDRLINEKLLGKRKLGFPLKYYYTNVQFEGRSLFYERIFFPKSKFDRLLLKIYERCLPGIKLFIWDENVREARERGYTLEEKMYHHWRLTPFIHMFGLSQMVHPWGWDLSQHKDAFIRRVDTMMPGIEAPDWANQTRRAHDLDFNSIQVPFKAFNNILEESTPAPHMNLPAYFAPQHYLTHRHNIGYAAQRLFYNEDIKGDGYHNGYLSEKDKNIVHGYYANSQGDSQKDRVDNLSESERAEFEKNTQKWDQILKEFFPEVSTSVRNPVMHKYDEQYYERNMNEIRSSIFATKWINATEKFSAEEIQNIYEFFLQENTGRFFTQDHEHQNEEYKPTPLYEKFIQELDFPDFYDIDRFTTYPPEKQFYDIMDRNWNVNFDTVDTYRAEFINAIKNNGNPECNSLVMEEIYNPLFKNLLKEKYNYKLAQGSSFVVEATKNGVSIGELNEIAKAARENVYLTSHKVLEQMVNSQVRKVVKTFLWKGKGL